MAWHRTVGKLSYIVFPLLILSFLPGIKKFIDSGDYKNVFFPIGDCLLLIVFYGLGIYFKKSPAKHMRYMINSSLVLLGPTLGRIGPRFFGLGDIGTQTMQYVVIFGILFGLIVADVKSGKNHTPYLIAVYGFTIHAVKFYLLFL